MSHPFVPPDFEVPSELVMPRFRLEPLDPRHNERDLAAWTSSIDHIRSTPGYPDGNWPPPEGMTLERNLQDLERHAADFERRVGFTYTVLDPDGEVFGCVYIYPDATGEADAEVQSWVRADRAELDLVLHRVVSDWIESEWPFEVVRYAARRRLQGE